MTKVSVIIPVYNCEKYLDDCLTSLVRQSLNDFEIICVNDGSTDKSAEILSKYAASDSRINIVSQSNLGAAAARNAGLELAGGKYVIFLDADDIFDECLLEKLYLKAVDTDSDIVVTNSGEYDGNAFIYTPYHLKKQYLPHKKEVFSYKDCMNHIFNFTIGWAWDKLYKREFLINTELKFQHLRTTNDVYFVFMSLVKAEKITVIDENLISHRINTSSQLSQNRDKSPLCFLEAIKALKSSLTDAGIYEFVKMSFINWVMEHTVWQIRTLKTEEVKQRLLTDVYSELKIFSYDEDYFYDKIAYQRMLQIFGWDVVLRNPKVSVVIPVYNVENYLDKCLEAVTRQTLKDIEIICVNDGSTDGSLKILEKYAEADKRIIIVNCQNGGLGKAYNAGLSISRGDYIGFVEPDDYPREDMYEILYKTAVKNNVDFVKGDFIAFDENNYVYKKLNTDGKFYNKRVKMADSLTPFRFIMNIWCGIYSRNFIEKYNIRYNETPGASYQDNGFWFQTFCLAEYGYFVDRPLYMHRLDNPNSSVKNKEKVFCMKEEYDFIRNFLEKNPNLKEKYLGIYHYKKYHNYMFTMKRIDKNFRPLFFKTFVEDFREAYNNNEIDETIFRADELERLHTIVNSPELFDLNQFGLQ